MQAGIFPKEKISTTKIGLRYGGSPVLHQSPNTFAPEQDRVVHHFKPGPVENKVEKPLKTSQKHL